MKLNQHLVSAEWLNKNLNQNELIVLDATINKVITSQSTKIKNARFFDIKLKFSDTTARFPSTVPSKEQFENEARLLGINNNSVIVVYDDKGIYSSARVWWLFRLFGCKNIAVLDGGFPEWKKIKFEIENYDTQNFSLGDFKAKFNPEILIDFKGINDLKEKTNYQIIDARSRERFDEKVDEPRKGLRRGKIPNSINLPYQIILENGKLKTKEELIDIFTSLNIENKTLIFSCGSGITACILALAFHIVGFKKYKIYDGSWTEYGTLTN